jgi:hypothetical protein
MTETFIERMQDELRQLNERMGKLEAFMSTEIFAGLDSMKQWLLREQYHAMVAYRRILSTRVDVHLGEANADLVQQQK